jgi:hypothetical protein
MNDDERLMLNRLQLYAACGSAFLKCHGVENTTFAAIHNETSDCEAASGRHQPNHHRPRAMT